MDSLKTALRTKCLLFPGFQVAAWTYQGGGEKRILDQESLETIELTIDSRDEGGVSQDEKEAHGDVQGELLAFVISGHLRGRQASV
jgi:hypothetical protein